MSYLAIKLKETNGNSTHITQDPDVDSQMHSASSSDDADSEAMFPAELDPPGSTTAQNNLGTLLDQQPDVTPPQSQEIGDLMDMGAPQSNAPGLEAWPTQSADNRVWVPESDFARSAAEIPQEPGAGWNNKKARDDYQRAMAQVEDRNFSLSKFCLGY